MNPERPVRVSAATAYKIGDFKTKGVSRWTALDSDVTAFDTEDSAAGTIHFENGAVICVNASDADATWQGQIIAAGAWMAGKEAAE